VEKMFVCFCGALTWTDSSWPQVARALMNHASDKAFDENPPVSDNIAALAKEAENEMKLDAQVMSTGVVPEPEPAAGDAAAGDAAATA
jgi:hypothetical protein